MGAENSTLQQKPDLNIDADHFQAVDPDQDIVKLYPQDAPQITYAKLSKIKPKLKLEVQNALSECKKSSIIEGQSTGSRLPVYEIIGKKGLYYQGEWKDGQENGRGIVYDINGNYRESYFKSGKAEGSGLHIYPDGSYYSGQFRKGVFNGFGKLFCKSNLMTYEGQWLDGKPHGRGKKFFPKVGVYEGTFQNGLMHGKGKMVWEDGRQYVGQFSEGHMQGRGSYRINESTFQGNFVKNKKIEGNLKTQKGEYQGQIKDGYMTGMGKFVWKSGKIYEGEFLHNKMHGNGTMTLQNGLKYKGVWQHGFIKDAFDDS